MRGLQLSPALKDLLQTTVTALLTVAAMGMFLRLAAHGLGPVEFGAFSVARRFISILAPLCTVMMGVALPRYLALSRGQGTSTKAYLPPAVLMGFGGGVVAVVVMLIFKQPISQTLFRSSLFETLVVATGLALLGEVSYRLLYAYLRGRERFSSANLINLTLTSIGPVALAAALATRVNAASLLTGIAIVMIFSLVPLTKYALQDWYYSRNLVDMRVTGRELLHYGLPRAPSALTLAGLLGMAPLLAPYFGDLADAAYLSIAQTVLRASEGVFVSFGLVALPRLAAHVGRNNRRVLATLGGSILRFTLDAGLYLALHLIVWADVITGALLGEGFSESVPLMRVTLLGLPSYAAYVLLRSVIDALETRAINTRNVFGGFILALFVSIALGLMGFGSFGLAIGSTSGWILTGSLSALFLLRRLSLNVHEFRLGELVLINLVLALLALLLHEVGSGSVVGGIVSETALGVFYLWFLRKRMRSPWMDEVAARFQITSKD